MTSEKSMYTYAETAPMLPTHINNPKMIMQAPGDDANANVELKDVRDIGASNRVSEQTAPESQKNGHGGCCGFQAMEEDASTAVAVHGRAGHLTWDGRPEHQFVKVRWADNKQESGVIAVSAVTFEDKADFALGQLVEVRDFEKPWREGWVVSLCPLKVSYKADGKSGKGYTWDQTRPLSKESCKQPEMQASFSVGQRVQMHDGDKPWHEGYVTSVNPLKVSYKVDGPEGEGYSWDYVRAFEFEAEAPSPEPEKCEVQPHTLQVDEQCASAPEVEYGFVQIPNYRSRQRSRGAKHVVSLPADAIIIVEGYPCSSYQPKQRDLNKPSFVTLSSANVRRKVRFSDGCFAGEESAPPQGTGPDANAEWMYIDRDTCGFSLFEYAPQVASYKDFHTQYGRDPLQEVAELPTCFRIRGVVLSRTGEGDPARPAEARPALPAAGGGGGGGPPGGAPIAIAPVGPRPAEARPSER